MSPSAPAVLAALALAANMGVVTASANAQPICELIGCWRECRGIAGRGHCCRTLCRRRCWQSPPRYEPPEYVRKPEPQYTPRHAAPVQEWRPSHQPTRVNAQRGDSATLLLVLGGAAVLVLAIVAAATGERAAVDKMHKKTDATQADTAQAAALVNKATSMADEIDSFISARLDEVYRAGRNSLPETGHD